MRRFYIPPNEWNPDALALRGPEVHHARDVLRLQRGDKLVVFNGRGREITAQIVDLARDQIRLRAVHESETPQLRCRITLAQAIPKGKSMDLIVQKAVEIGASEIVPLISARTIVDLDLKEATQKHAKWQQVATEAAKQSGQNWLPQIALPRKLAQFFSDLPQHDLRLIGSLQPDARHLKKILGDYEKEHRKPPIAGSPVRTVLILIGPEGDFTPAELALAKSNGCLPTTLGPIILRVETAAIYCLSVLSYELL
jgi:16S rRNA (uracil1498-N3)-methyltransferase